MAVQGEKGLGRRRSRTKRQEHRSLWSRQSSGGVTKIAAWLGAAELEKGTLYFSA